MPKLTHESDGLIYNPTNEVKLMLCKIILFTFHLPAHDLLKPQFRVSNCDANNCMSCFNADVH